MKYRKSKRFYVKLPEFVTVERYVIETLKDGRWLPLGEPDEGMWRFESYIQRDEKLAEININNTRG